MSVDRGGRRCDTCAHWRARPGGHKGDCLKSGFTSNTYRVAGIQAFGHGAEVYEETKPDHWCVLHEETQA